MADDPQMIRRWNLLHLLGARHHGITMREMARELGVTQRTIQRELDFFRLKCVPLECVTGERGRKAWRLGEGWRRPPLVFNFEEAAALYLGRQFLEPMAGTPFWEAARSAWRKIRSTMGETALNYLDRFARMFHAAGTDRRDYAGKAEILESLTLAIEEHRAAHVTYRSLHATESATRDLYPLSWIWDAGSLYLLAFSPEDDRIKTYKVDRMEAVEVSNFVFQLHRDFDAAAYLSGSLGIYDGDGDIAVAIRFLPSAARHAQESRWHRSKVFTPQRDGSVILRLRLSSTVEIKSRILAYGAAAVVLEPESLRAEIAAELERMLQAYQAPASANARDRSGTG
jgi:predicted DNA-binding transcriptional regulator YafY